MQLQRAIHEKLQGMDLQVRRVIFPPEALELPYAFLRLPGRGDHIAAVHIDGQLPLLIQRPKASVDVLMKFRKSRNAGIEDARHADTDTEINPALKRSVNRRIGLIHCAVQNDRQLRRALAHLSGHMPVLAHVKAQARHRILDLVCDAMPL